MAQAIVRLRDTVYSSAMERTTRQSDATLQQAYEILAEDAETAEVEELMAVQAETLLDE